MIATTVFLAGLRGSIIIFVAWIAAIALRRKSAALRHSIWSIAIASQIALPIVALLLPQRALNLGPVGAVMTRAAPIFTPPPVSSKPPAASDLSPPSRPIQSTGVPRSLSAIPGAPSIVELITLLWAAGAALMLLRFAIGTWLVARETRNASRPVRREWVLLAGQVQEEMALDREAVLLWGSKREVPYTWGIVRPVVCLPADADRWSLDRLRIVMLHELAHVERFDTLGEFVAQFALVIFWFNPLVWLAVRRMRTEREHACDDRVLTRGVKPSTYVEELVMMMKSIGSGALAPGFGAIAMARRTQFEARMFAVLDERADRHGIASRNIVAIAAIMFVLMLGVASVRPASASPTALRVTTGRTESAKSSLQGSSDFDEQVADCNRPNSKDKPRIGVRYCEVRNVDLSALSGSIAVEGGYLSGVIFVSSPSAGVPAARMLIRANALTPNDARLLASQVRALVQGGVLQASGPGGSQPTSWSALFEVTLPAGRSVRARTENGPIILVDFAGNAELAAVNGPIEVHGSSGDIRGHSQNGALIVGLSGSRWDGRGLDLRSENGPVYLTIAKGYSAHLITGTVNGPMQLNYPLMVRRMYDKALETDVGEGGTEVRVSTINGPAYIR